MIQYVINAGIESFDTCSCKHDNLRSLRFVWCNRLKVETTAVIFISNDTIARNQLRTQSCHRLDNDGDMAWKHGLLKWPFLRRIRRIPDEFPPGAPVMYSLYVFVVLSLNKPLNKQSSNRCLGLVWCRCDILWQVQVLPNISRNDINIVIW